MWLLAAACCLAMVLPQAQAWGAASHYYFTCSAAGVPLHECLDHKNLDLLSGTELPDAFGFSSLLSPLSEAPIPGQGWEYMDLHSPMLAGYLYKTAPQFMTPTFNATAFAIGYGMHVVADAAGFYDHGYLGYGWGHQYVPLVNNTANWLALWPFMEAVDAHVYDTYFRSTGKRLPIKSVPSASKETAQFLVGTVQAAISNGSVFSNISVPLVQQLAAVWQSMLSEESIKVEATPAAVSGWAMTYYDRYGAKNATQARQHFEIVRRCAVKAANVWHESIRLADSTPQMAVDAAIGYVVTAYAQGQCTPQQP